MRIVIEDTSDRVADYVSILVTKQIQCKPNTVLGLATGATPLLLYKKLVEAYRLGGLSFAEVSTFNLDEYVGLPPAHAASYHYYMRQHLFDLIDIKLANTHLPDGMATDLFQSCDTYEAAIQHVGGIDLQLLGIGANGHIGFNEPSSSLASRTRIKTLTAGTMAANVACFDGQAVQPDLAITMGIGTILEARQIVLLATGIGKAAAVASMVEGPVSASCPASILQMHPNVTVVIDKAAAEQLGNIEFYRHIEATDRRVKADVYAYREALVTFKKDTP